MLKEVNVENRLQSNILEIEAIGLIVVSANRFRVVLLMVLCQPMRYCIRLF